MSFSGQTAIVFSVTGNIGRSAAKAFLEAGATVVAPVRQVGKLQKLQRLIDTKNLVEVQADISTKEGAAAILKAANGQADHVVSSFGPWWDLGPLSTISPEDYRKVYEANLDPHFHAWRTLAPVMLDRPGASYSIVTGAAGLTPGANGITGIAATALFGLSDGVLTEAKGRELRANEIRIAIRVEDDEVVDKQGEAGVTRSSQFGVVFTKIAQTSNLKSQVILVDQSKFEELSRS